MALINARPQRVIPPFSQENRIYLKSVFRSRTAEFARLGLLERIRLTPEGVTDAEQRGPTKALLATGNRVFIFSCHSPSLTIGNASYLQPQAGLARFLGRLERYFDYFINELGGRPATPSEVRDMLRPLERVLISGTGANGMGPGHKSSTMPDIPIIS